MMKMKFDGILEKKQGWLTCILQDIPKDTLADINSYATSSTWKILADFFPEMIEDLNFTRPLHIAKVKSYQTNIYNTEQHAIQ